MGIIRRQGVKNSIFNYLGVALGFLNVVFIMTKVLSLDEYGLCSVILKLGSFFSVLTLAGSSNIINRFFPYFKGQGKRHGDLLSVLIKYILVSGLIAVGLSFVLRPLAIHIYYDKARLLVDYYYYLVPLGASLAIFELISSYCRVLLKSTVSVFVKEVAVRFGILTILGLLHFGVIDFELFFKLYVLSNAVGAIVLMAYLQKIGELKVSLKVGFRGFPKFLEMLRFGLYSMFNTSMSLTIRMVDLLMLTSMAFSSSGLAAAAIYGLGSHIVTAISVPANGVKQIAAPLLADAFSNEDFKRIESINQKTGLTLLIAGLFIMGLVVINLVSILGIMKEGYIEAQFVVYFIGGARVLEMSCGMTNRVIVESKFFRYNLLFNVCMLLLVFVTNSLLIPKFEIMGAAMATAISIVTMVLIKVWFVYTKFGFNPYNVNTLKAVLVGLLCLFTVYIIPKTDIILVDLAYRSVLFSALFGVLVYTLKISVDINEFIDSLYRRFLRPKKG